MLSIVIVEDEDSAANSLETLIEEYGEKHNEKFSIVRFYDAVGFVKNYKPVYDIVFMDIVLPRMNGFEAAKRLREIDKNITLVFVTNMVNYALKGYEVGALDFIVKPVKRGHFEMKFKRVVDSVKNRKAYDISIMTGGSLKVIAISDIIYVEASMHNLIYHTTYGDFKTRESMKSIDSKLPSGLFVKCNVCYLVNMQYIQEVNGDNVTVGGVDLHISRAKKKSFMNALTDYFGRNI